MSRSPSGWVGGAGGFVRWCRPAFHRPTRPPVLATASRIVRPARGCAAVNAATATINHATVSGSRSPSGARRGGVPEGTSESICRGTGGAFGARVGDGTGDEGRTGADGLEPPGVTPVGPSSAVGGVPPPVCGTAPGAGAGPGAVGTGTIGVPFPTPGPGPTSIPTPGPLVGRVVSSLPGVGRVAVGTDGGVKVFVGTPTHGYPGPYCARSASHRASAFAAGEPTIVNHSRNIDASTPASALCASAARERREVGPQSCIIFCWCRGARSRWRRRPPPRTNDPQATSPGRMRERPERFRSPASTG
ncbi:hypothetical protein LX13_001535 [Williamsia maris]|uniref:Collagen triple helix repeat protein n=1 Tax=Williamsia maris TaxID=72806 RepID=A0ABT1HBU2_9NOCA|nr:hypothetical protein [Williamsia maris]